MANKSIAGLKFEPAFDSTAFIRCLNSFTNTNSLQLPLPNGPTCGKENQHFGGILWSLPEVLAKVRKQKNRAYAKNNHMHIWTRCSSVVLDN